jgi:L-seryl-tRNA(Ser) seleniumtransferase
MTDLRSLPSVDQLLRDPIAPDLISEYGRPLTLDALRETLENIRGGKYENKNKWTGDEILIKSRSLLEEWTYQTLRPVINATGVILHTNLGRAPLLPELSRRDHLKGYSSLEYDLAGGERSTRSEHVEKLLTRLTGAEAAFVVNNNAAAVLLALSALCKRKRVIISRSQLVEIGGGFRIPEVLAESGAKMVEVGTTNRVHATDYQQAAQEGAGAILRAHPSNYRVTGFTSEIALEELAEIAHKNSALLIDDLGSGALLETRQFGLAHEPMVQESIAAGADLVCFSGDKLLGGPQAGIILGKRELIAKIGKHPLARAVRIDKLCLTFLCQTLDLYLRDRALEIPVWSMITLPVGEIERRAENWRNQLQRGEVIDGFSTIGGGSLPGETLPTRLLALRVKSPQKVLSALRQGKPPVIARIEQDQIVFDPRTVFPDEDKEFLGVLHKITPV